MDEKRLIELCQSGDTAAFEELIEPHQKRVINTAYGLLSNTEDAYDAAQEAFIKAFTHIASFDMRASFSTWIHRITVNVCLDELRRRKRKDSNLVSLTVEDGEGHESQRPLADASSDPQQRLEQNERSRLIKQAIDELPQEYKTVLILREISGLSYDEIAIACVCSVGTVKSRINRGRKILSEKLKKNKELFL